MNVMTNDDTAAGLPVGNWPQVRSGPLMAGGILVGIGTLVVLAGFAVAGTHVIAATRAWVKELETPPSQLSRLKWEQAKAAMSAGTTAWQKHPNSQVHLARRASTYADC